MNLAIWNAVEKTDPAFTKHVSQRGGFTAISANYQIMQATKQFGPVGIGWGYISGEPIFHETLIFVPVTLWHGDRSNTFGPMLGCEEWKDGKGRIDSDASKKATTDAITKLLSQLGFSADVFLGKYDDQKYVAMVAREFEAEKAPKIDSLALSQEIEACETMAQLQKAFERIWPIVKGSEYADAIIKTKNAQKTKIQHMDKVAA